MDAEKANEIAHKKIKNIEKNPWFLILFNSLKKKYYIII